MTAPQRTSEVLDAAADRIQRLGWWHPTQSAGRGGCASNAILRVCRDELGMDSAVDYVEMNRPQNALATYLVGPGACITAIFTWNDAPGRTAGEVIAVLRACAAEQRLREDTEAGVTQVAEVAS